MREFEGSLADALLAADITRTHPQSQIASPPSVWHIRERCQARTCGSLRQWLLIVACPPDPKTPPPRAAGKTVKQKHAKALLPSSRRLTQLQRAR